MSFNVKDFVIVLLLLITLLILFQFAETAEPLQQTHYYKRTKFILPNKCRTKLTLSASESSKEDNFLNQLVTDCGKDTKELSKATAQQQLLANFKETRNGKAQIINKPIQQEEGSFCRRSFDGRSGYCIQAYQCLHVVHEYRIHGTKIDICSYQNNIPVICCPLINKEDIHRISAKKCQEYHDSLKGINIDLKRTFSGKICVSSVPLIIGGKITRTGEYPHMAALGWSQPNNNKIKWGCGGSLISKQFVLTAAHCTSSGGKTPDIVRLGAQNLNNPSADSEDIGILIIILHPKYNSSLYYHDIALLKLRKRVTFTNFIRPACLWLLPDIETSSTIAVGWGRTKYQGPKSDDLQKVELNFIDQKICENLYRNERKLPKGIDDSHLCAGFLEGGKDTCQGDSGGPLHVKVPEFKCVKFIVGITSFGKFCAAPNTPGVYTKIYAYLDWIEKIVFDE